MIIANVSMPMSGSYLLDSNIVIAILRSQPLAVQLPQDYTKLAINVTVLGEIMFGAVKSAHRDQGLLAIQALAAKIRVFDCTPGTCLHYAELRNYLSSIGKPLPENDIWIAASALEHHLTLATRDAHFDVIPHLLKERW